MVLSSLEAKGSRWASHPVEISLGNQNGPTFKPLMQLLDINIIFCGVCENASDGNVWNTRTIRAYSFINLGSCILFPSSTQLTNVLKHTFDLVIHIHLLEKIIQGVYVCVCTCVFMCIYMYT